MVSIAINQKLNGMCFKCRSWAEKIPGRIERASLPRLSEISGDVKTLDVKIESIRNETKIEIEGLENETKIEIDGLRKEIESYRKEMMSGFQGLDYRFESMDHRFEAINTDLS
ncbi:MAG: hypothetical protein O8C66_03875 [Candidatus Methanoperedens sp.]|nr:hypothetical protein [Candidatus Methanoperedens sp.]MCZ7369625.1 hypothetical protein [Candidatus Methanoperedens sp.]